MPTTLGIIGGAPVFPVELGAAPAPRVLSAAELGHVRVGAPWAPNFAPETAPLLPATVELGATTIHRYVDPRVVGSDITITVFAPLAPNEGWLVNANGKPFTERLPQRFIMGDGGHTRALVGVDQRPGTPLDRHLRRILDQIPRRDGTIDPEVAIQFVTQRINDFIGWAPGGAYGDGRPFLPWDRAVSFTSAIWTANGAARGDDVAQGLVRGTGERSPVVPLERYLELGLGYCLQQSLLGALILDRVGVPVRVVNGALDFSPGTTSGHTWIELGDGRAIDPGWRTIDHKIFNNSTFVDRFWLGNCYRFANQNYPALVLEGPAPD